PRPARPAGPASPAGRRPARSAIHSGGRRWPASSPSGTRPRPGRWRPVAPPSTFAVAPLLAAWGDGRTAPAISQLYFQPGFAGRGDVTRTGRCPQPLRVLLGLGTGSPATVRVAARRARAARTSS